MRHIVYSDICLRILLRDVSRDDAFLVWPSACMGDIFLHIAMYRFNIFILSPGKGVMKFLVRLRDDMMSINCSRSQSLNIYLISSNSLCRSTRSASCRSI